MPDTLTRRLCPACNTVRDLDDFGLVGAGVRTLAPRCARCVSGNSGGQYPRPSRSRTIRIGPLIPRVPDRGCRYAPSCFACPLPECVYVTVEG